jgi:hypothetical protein
MLLGYFHFSLWYEAESVGENEAILETICNASSRTRFYFQIPMNLFHQIS